MHDIVFKERSKFKWGSGPTDPTRFRLYYPPPRAPRKTQQWDNWVAAMMMDMRLNSTDRVVLTRLALHYNLKAGHCFPALRRVALGAGLGAAGIRTVQRTIRTAEKLGWIERTVRKGGPREKNQTNLYELRLAESIIGCREKGLAITGEPGAWLVSQVSDGAVVCGPFKSKEKAETWIENHGLGTDRHDKPRGTTRQRGATDTTIDPAITGKLQNREVIEHSVSKDTASLRDAPQERSVEGRKGTSEGEIASAPRLPTRVGYTEEEVETVRDGIACYGLDTIAAVVSYCRQMRLFVTANIVGHMVRDGHFGRDGDRIFPLHEEETS